MNSSMKRAVVILILVVMAAGFSVTAASADMGPKPSITLTVTNGPEEYYVALLSLRDHQPNKNSTLMLETVDEEYVKTYLDSFCYDKWGWYKSPVGKNYYHSSKDATYVFDYSVPEQFRVIMIAGDGTVYLSADLTKTEFDAECTYDVITGMITEQREHAVASRIAIVVVNFLATILVETIVLLFFYPCTARNLLCLFLINALTNIPFNIYMVYYNTSRSWLMLGPFFGGEIIIIFTEAILYSLLLRTKDGEKSWSKGIRFAVIGNLFSAFSDLLMPDFMDYLKSIVTGWIENFIK